MPQEQPADADAFAPTLARLRALPEEFNAAIKLDYQLTLLEAAGRVSLIDLLLLRPRIERAAEVGEREINRVSETMKALRKLPARPRRDRAPVGF